MYSSKKVPKGSHRMPDGSIMKNKGPPQRSSEQKPKKQKLTDNCPDSSRCSQNSSLKYSDNLSCFTYQYFSKNEEYFYDDSSFFGDPFEKDFREDYLNPEQKENIQDNYSVLGLKKSASDEDIKLAFRKKILETHPDKVGGDGAEFIKVRQAYESLI